MPDDPDQTIPARVLERARRLALKAKAPGSSVPPPPTPPRSVTQRLRREKVIAALRRLHPMD